MRILKHIEQLFAELILVLMCSNCSSKSCPPPLLHVQVLMYNLAENKHGPDDVLVMGTDGLWDVTTDRDAADAVTAFLSCCDPSDPMRCTPPLLNALS